MGRALQIVNSREELVCFVQKSTKALIQEVRYFDAKCVVLAAATQLTWHCMHGIAISSQQKSTKHSSRK
jgi:hypothetical protein